MSYAKVYMKGTSIVIAGSNSRTARHEHLLEECGFKIITKFYSNGQPTPIDGFGWRCDKYFVINDRIAKMQRMLDGVDAPFMAIVSEVRRNAGIKAIKNRIKREKLVVGKIYTKHEVPLLSCPECGKMLKVKVRNKHEPASEGYGLVHFVETACCRIRYLFADINRTRGHVRVDLRNYIRRGVTEYTTVVDSLPDDIKFKVGIIK